MIVATGVGSGLDIESLVTQLVEAEGAPAGNRLLNSERNITSSISALAQFKGSLSNLESAISGLDSADIFNKRTASSTDNSAIVARASDSAVAASYEVRVNQLAKAHSLASTSYASISDEVGEGTLTLRFGTTDYTSPDPGPEAYDSFVLNPETDTATIVVDSTNNSLEGLRNSINDADINVSASIINDGSGFRLLLTSKQTGADQSIEIAVDDTGDGDNTNASGLSRFAFNASATQLEQTVAAQNSNLSINGIDIIDSSNEITSAVEGVTFFLNDISESEAKVSINEDKSAAVSAIQGLVSSYNNFLNTTEAVSGYNADTKVGGPLQGDFTVRGLVSQVRQLITGELDASVGEFTRLSEVGIRSEADGRLSFDQSIYDAAYENNPSDLVGIFTSIGVPSDGSITYESAESETAAGNYDINITQVASRATLTGSVLSFPLVIDSSNDGFVLSLNEKQSGNLLLTQGSYANGDDLVAELQSRINGDAVFAENGFRVVVELDSSSGAILIQSEEYGADNKIELISADTGFTSAFGFITQTEYEGTDVDGTIGGELADGDGQYLTGAEGTNAEGLRLFTNTQSTGTYGSVAYSSGIADQINSLIGGYLDTGGTLDSRIESYEDQIEDIAVQRERLNARLESIEERFRRQFNALDGLLARLQSTGNFLTEQLDALPGPKKQGS